LGSTDRSLFYWTPLTFPAFAGLIYLAFRTRCPAARILAVAVVMQIYTMSALLGQDVFLGASFGFRFLTETCVLMVPGAAVLFQNASKRTSRWLAVGGCLAVGWNLVLVAAFRRGVGLAAGGAPAEVFAMVIGHVRYRPLEALGVLVLVSWLTCTILVAFRFDRGQIADAVPERLAA
jgi:hypothetical protein